MQRIVDLLEKECCIFIGAGIPKALGFPLWGELAKDLILFTWEKRKELDESKIYWSLILELEDRVDKGDPIVAITFCSTRFKEAGKESEYQEKIIEWLHDEVKYRRAKESPVYIQINRLIKSAIVIQTNLDKSIEEFCRLPTHLNTSLPTAISIPSLIYLHGIITDPTSWILTRDEYNNFYQRNATFTSFIQKVFQNYNVLFLGYSLSDKEILDQIAKVKGSGKQYLLVLEEIEKDKISNVVFEDDLKNYNINVIRYNVEREGYTEFVQFLAEINGLMKPLIKFAEQGQDGGSIDG